MAVAEFFVPTIGILGTVAGTALGGRLTYRTEKVKAVHEQQKQWRDARLKAYVALLQSTADEVASGFEHAGVQLDVIIANQGEGATKEQEDKLAELSVPHQRVKLALAETELLATTAVASAAQRLVKAVDRFSTASFHRFVLVFEKSQEIRGLGDRGETDEAVDESGEDDGVDSKVGVVIGAFRKAEREEQEARSHFCLLAQRELGLAAEKTRLWIALRSARPMVDS